MTGTRTIIGVVLLGLLLLPRVAAADSDAGQLRPVAPPAAQPPPPPLPDELDDPVYPTSPVGAFTLRAGQIGLRAEVGYPFLDLSLSIGLVSWRLQLEGGYRGLYGMTNALYGGLKWNFVHRADRRIGVALRVIAGYNDIRKEDWEYQQYQNMVGGGHGFGEGALLLSARGKSNTAFLFSMGLRISEYRPRACSPGPACVGNRKVSYTAFGEVGFVSRIGWRTSYFFTVGVDVFEGLQDWLPALLRMRTGIAVDF